MLINALTNVNKLYLIVKCYQLLIQIDLFVTNTMRCQTETLSHGLIKN